MGLSYSTPAIAQTAAGASGANLGFTVFFGNGYNSPSQRAVPVCARSAKRPRPRQDRPVRAGAVGLRHHEGQRTVQRRGGQQHRRRRRSGHDALRRRSGGQRLARGHHQCDTGGLGRVGAVPGNRPVRRTLSRSRPCRSSRSIRTFRAFRASWSTSVPARCWAIPDLASTQVQTMYGIYDSGTIRRH